jgi:hypothetical protein
MAELNIKGSSFHPEWNYTAAIAARYGDAEIDAPLQALVLSASRPATA